MRPTTSLYRLATPFVALSILACGRSVAPLPAGASGQAQNTDNSTVKLSGAFHIVWGDSPSYVLVDSAGRPTSLVVSSELLERHKGARSLDRRRVTVTGTRMPDRQATLRVLSISLDSLPG